MIHGPQLLALFLIALVVACLLGMTLVVVRDSVRNRRLDRRSPR
jgi:hypothetical protein